MTITVGRTQIHLGWPAAGSIVLFLIGITWEAAMLFSSFINGQHDMQRQLSIISRRDSIYYSKVDEQEKQISSLKQYQYHIDSLMTINKRVANLYTEKNH